MQEPDLSLLRDAAKAAGVIAAKHFRQNPETWDKGGGQGPVTEADIEVDTMLRTELTAARPDYGWLSEETADTGARLERERVFIVDPIDGTRAFMEGKNAFSHALCVVENGVPLAAVIYLPMMDLMFTASRGGGAQMNGMSLGTSARLDLDGAELLGNKSMFAAAHWGGPLPVTQHFRSSLAYRMALVAQGAFDGMITLRPSWEWDIAAGDLIAREAGATVTDRAGGALRFNNTHPQVAGVLAAPANVHEGLMARLKQPVIFPGTPLPQTPPAT